MSSNELTVDRLFINSDGTANRLKTQNLGFVETGQDDTLYIWPSSTSFITTKNTTGPQFLLFSDGATDFGGYLGSVGGFSMNTAGGQEGINESTFTWNGNVDMTQGASVQLGTVSIQNLTLASSVIIQGGASIEGDSLAQGTFSFKKGITVDQTNLVGDLNLGDGVKLITSSTSDISANANLSVAGDASFNNVYLGGDISFNLTAFPNDSIPASAIIGDVGGSSNDLSGNVSITGDLSLNEVLIVGRDASFNGNVYIFKKLVVNEDLSLNANLKVSGDASFNDGLYVRNSLFLGTTNVGTQLVDLDASVNDLNISINQLDVSANLAAVQRGELDVSVNDIEVRLAAIELDGSIPSHFDVSINQLDVSANLAAVHRGELDVSVNDVELRLTALELDGSVPSHFDVSINQLDVSANVASTRLSELDVSVNQLLDSSSSNKSHLLELDASVNQLDVSANVASTRLSELDVSINSVENRIATLETDTSSSESPIFTGLLTASDDVLVNKRLFVVGDVSLNAGLYVAGDLSWNSANIAADSIPAEAIIGGVGSNNMTGLVVIDGDLSLNYNLSVGEDVNLKRNIDIQGTTTMKGLTTSEKATLHSLESGSAALTDILTVAGEATFSDKIVGLTDLSLNNNVSIGGETTLNGKLIALTDLSVNNGLNVNNGATFNGDVELKNNLVVHSDLSLNGSLTMNGATTLKGPTIMNQAANLDSTLTVANNTDLQSDLAVAGVATFSDKLVGLADLSVNNTALFGGDVSMNGDLYVQGNLVATYPAGSIPSSAISGLSTNDDEVLMNNGLVVTGDSSFNDNLFIAKDLSLNDNLSVGGTLDVNGAATFKSGIVNLTDLSLNNNLSVGGDVSFNKGLNVATTLNANTLVMHGDASFNENVFIGKDLVIDGNLTVEQYTNENIINTTTTDYQLIIAEDLSLNGRLFVADDASFNNNVAIYSNKVATSTTDAALTITGGMGVGGFIKQF